MDAKLVDSFLDSHQCRWFPGLAKQLARTRWNADERLNGLDRSTYGTERYITSDPRARRLEQSLVSLPNNFEANEPILVEMLYGEALKRYTLDGLNFYSCGEINSDFVHDRLDCALRRLGSVPGVDSAVGALVAAIHILKPASPDYDVSSSDPYVPFSIFVGIDAKETANWELRLAEGILHECMHLQLSLMEQALPLTTDDGGFYLSPWRGTMRPTLGVLHGLYVFRVIQDFYRTLLCNRAYRDEELAYLNRRIAEIETEVATVRELLGSRDLTNAGKRFVASLLSCSQ
jgi:hypothetical protein